MNILDSQKWVRHRDSKPPKQMPECDRLLQVVSTAGAVGISRHDLGQEIELERNTLDDLISAFVRLGQINMAMERGEQIIRAAVSRPS